MAVTWLFTIMRHVQPCTDPFIYIRNKASGPVTQASYQQQSRARLLVKFNFSHMNWNLPPYTFINMLTNVLAFCWYGLLHWVDLWRKKDVGTIQTNTFKTQFWFEPTKCTLLQEMLIRLIIIVKTPIIQIHKFHIKKFSFQPDLMQFVKLITDGASVWVHSHFYLTQISGLLAMYE